MLPDFSANMRRVKWVGQLAQLSSCAVPLFTVATLAAAALTVLVMGFPQKALVLLREALSDHRHW